MEKKKEEVKKLTIAEFVLPLSFLTISVILLTWFNLSDSIFTRIIVVGIFIAFVIPVYFKIYIYKISGKVRRATGFEIDSKGVITEKKQKSSNNFKKETTYKKDYKPKVIESENYTNLRNVLIASSKNQLLTREDILCIKSEINTLLGSHQFIYSDFKFNNDMQEIYTKIRSSKMNDVMWEYLLEVVNNINAKVVE